MIFLYQISLTAHVEDMKHIIDREVLLNMLLYDSHSSAYEPVAYFDIIGLRAWNASVLRLVLLDLCADKFKRIHLYSGFDRFVNLDTLRALLYNIPVAVMTCYNRP